MPLLGVEAAYMHDMQLKANTLLQGGKYKILGVLGQGGFGITYLAENTMLDGKVAIKEFFFKEYCDRDDATRHVTIGTSGNRGIVERFKAKFIKEARTIFKLNHPNIIRILDIFEENGTAYYVMDYIEGESLSNMVKRRGYIPEAEAVGYIREVGSALSYIHSRSMNHLDIKPGNIMKRREDGKILVIDFGVAKQYDEVTSEGTTTTPVGISKGYSPNEQYVLSGVQSFSPQSDVYALAATLFKLLTGNTPPEAAIVLDEGLPVGELRAKGISAPVISAIDNAMQSKSRRTQSVDAFLSALSSGKMTNTSNSASQDESTSFIDSERQAKNLDDSTTNEEDLPMEKSGLNPWMTVLLIIIVSVMVGYAYYTNEVNEVKPITVENVSITINKGHDSKRQFTYTGHVDSQGLPDGEGKAQFPKTASCSSSTFTGTFEHGLMQEGELVFSNGNRFKGTFTNGQCVKGTWTESDGYYFVGTFYNSGDPYNGTWYKPDGSEDSKVVNGQ